MHDNTGRPLKIGDSVLIPGRVTAGISSEDFGNIGVESFFGRKPDDRRERFTAFNSNVVLRANVGDDNSQFTQGFPAI